MAIADDISVAFNGDVRYTGTTANHTGLAFHRFIADLSDDAIASGDDLHDITQDDASDRSTDNIFTLLPPFNIDDDLAEHLYDCSITQDGGDTIYKGLVVVGAVEANTELEIIQGDKVLRNYWGTGINADAPNNILMRLLIKARVNGVDKDASRIRVQAKELSDSYAEFLVTMGLGNNTAAIFTADDGNNQTAEATIDGWDSITNTEGLRAIDVDNDTITEQYYSEWNRDTFTINQLYERTKWIQKRPSAADSATETGTDYIVDNATILGQAQEFVARDQAEKLTSCKFFLKEGGGTPVGTLVAELYDSDDVATGAPTGAVLASSEPVLVGVLGSTYAEIEFVFADSVTMSASSVNFIALRNAAGTATDFVHVRGAAAGSHGGNLATDTSGTWAGVAAADLSFSVHSSPVIHDMAGQLFRGITHSLGYDTEAGLPTLATNEELGWGTLIQLSGVTGTFLVGEAVHEDTATPAWKGEVVSYDVADTSLLIVLESGTITATDTFTGQESGATATADSSQAPQGTGANANSGARMKLLAFEDDGTDGELYVQLLSGTIPVDNEELYVTLDNADSLPAHDQSVLVSVAKLAITQRTISPAFIGQSTGSAILGAYGLGIEKADLSASDKLRDLTNTERIPPNNVTFDVFGLVSSEDRVLVGPEDGAAGLDRDQMTLLTSLTTGAETAVVLTAAIPVDTPGTGSIRIQLDTGIYRLQTYTSYTGSTFTIPSTSYTGANIATNPRDVFVGYIDKLAAAATESFTTVYDADRTLFVRVRDGGASPIKSFKTTSVLSSTGGSSTATRTSDA